MPAPSRSQQDYLKALYALSSGGAGVTTSGLADRLGVSAPSVTNMLRRLAAARLVAHAPRAGARLTPRGRRLAIDIVRRHRILETFLVRVLGLDWADVHDDAEVLEHHISDRVLDAIDRLVGHPAEDPHGHPIPDRAGRVRRRALRPLAALANGERAIVRELREGGAARMARWKERGLVPGAAVRMADARPAEGVYEIEVAGERQALGGAGLEGVFVETGGRRAAAGRRPR